MNKHSMAWVLLLMPFFLNSGNTGTKEAPQKKSTHKKKASNEKPDVDVKTARDFLAQHMGRIYNYRGHFDEDEQVEITQYYDIACRWLVFLTTNDDKKMPHKIYQDMVRMVDTWDQALGTPPDGYEEVDAIPVRPIKEFFNYRTYRLQEIQLSGHAQDIKKLHDWWHELMRFSEYQENLGQAPCIPERSYKELNNAFSYLEEKAHLDKLASPDIRLQKTPRITVFDLLPDFKNN